MLSIEILLACVVFITRGNISFPILEVDSRSPVVILHACAHIKLRRKYHSLLQPIRYNHYYMPTNIEMLTNINFIVKKEMP